MEGKVQSSPDHLPDRVEWLEANVVEVELVEEILGRKTSVRLEGS